MNIVNLLTSYQGRIRRLHFWLATIGVVVVTGIIDSVINGMNASAMASGSPNIILTVLSYLVDAVYLYVIFAIYVKRCHDRDKNWWWSLIFVFVPVVGWIWGLVELGFLDGTQGPNRFGPSPKGIGGEAPAPAAS